VQYEVRADKTGPARHQNGWLWFCHAVLREKHLGCCRSNHKRADDLGPVFESSQHNTFVQFFRHHNRVPRHQSGLGKTVHQQSTVSLAAHCCAIHAGHKRAPFIAIAGSSTAKRPRSYRSSGVGEAEERSVWVEETPMTTQTNEKAKTNLWRKIVILRCKAPK
jgi:hypothetical protein